MIVYKQNSSRITSNVDALQSEKTSKNKKRKLVNSNSSSSSSCNKKLTKKNKQFLKSLGFTVLDT